MKVVFKESKKISAIRSSSSRLGSYALLKTPLVFEDCRERFAPKIDKKTESFLFKHEKDAGENVASFILKTEKILKKRKFTQFSKTNVKDVICVEPTKFWMQNKMTRSLFTILLRVGISYNPEDDNYEEVLFSHHHIEITKNATKRFLFGFTKYVGDQPSGSGVLETFGWVTLLKDKTESEVKSLFVLPNKKQYKSTFDLREDIWI